MVSRENLRSERVQIIEDGPEIGGQLQRQSSFNSHINGYSGDIIQLSMKWYVKH